MEQTIKKVGNRKVYYNSFESHTEYINHIKKFVDNKSSLLGTSCSNSEGFTGTKDIQESFKIAERGYELDTIDAELQEIKGTDQFELVPTFDVSGSEIDMGLLMTGIPEHMIEFNIQEVQNRYVHVVIGMSDACLIGADQILHRAAGVCSLIDRLESNQYRVKLSYHLANNTGFGPEENNPNSLMVPIKDYDQHLPMTELAGMLHPGFYRRIGFAYWETHKDWKSPMGKGTCPAGATSKKWAKEHPAIDKDENFVYLPSITEGGGGSHGILESKFRNFEDAKEYAKYVSENIEDLYSEKV